MDNKIIRFYNQNRYLFWAIVVTIVGIVGLIHALNHNIEKQNEKNVQISANINNNVVKNTNIDENYTVISGKKLNYVTTNIIKSFIEYCNTGEVEKAYQLLSDDCKEILYPDLETFTKQYVNRIFNSKKLFACQAMITDAEYHTYQINFTEDMLAKR